MDRTKSVGYSNIYFIAFALKRKVLKGVKEKVISTADDEMIEAQLVELMVINSGRYVVLTETRIYQRLDCD